MIGTTDWAGRCCVAPGATYSSSRLDRKARHDWLRRDRAPRRVVVATARRVPRARYVHCVRHVGRVPRDALPLRTVSITVLLTRGVRRVSAELVRPGAPVVADVAAVVSRLLHSLGTGRFPTHLLLLPRRLLQGVLGGPTGLHRRRAPDALPRRALVPTDPAERASLLLVRRTGLPLFSFLRRFAGAAVPPPPPARCVGRRLRGHARSRP